MRIIDDKGKLLGLVNPFDAVILASILAVVFVIGWLAFSRGGSPISGATRVEVHQTYLVRAQPAGITQYLKKGDRVKDELTKADLGEVMGASEAAALVSTPGPDGRLITARSGDLKDVTVRVMGQGRDSRAVITVDGDILEVGKEYTLNTKWFWGEAILVGLETKAE